MKDRIILDLCGGTGAWSKPYVEADYDVRLITLPEHDVRLYRPPDNVHGILAAPPCTMFAISGIRWKRTDNQMIEALSIVDACLRIVYTCKPVWWAMENPVGKLPRYIGRWQYTFQPYEYGDPWLKRTCIWGQHTKPVPKHVDKPDTTQGRWRVSLTNHLSPKPTAEQISNLVKSGMLSPDWIHRCPPSADRATLRSITPPGFARAFFESNP